MIIPVKIVAGGTQAAVSVVASGMTLDIPAGWYANGEGSVAWPDAAIPFTTPAADQSFCVWVSKDGTLAAAQVAAPSFPSPPANMLDRICWGTIPAGCADLSAAAINVLTLVQGG